MEVTTEAVGARESCAVCIDNVKEAPRFHSWKPRPQQKKRKKKDEEGWGKVGWRGRDEADGYRRVPRNKK